MNKSRNNSAPNNEDVVGLDINDGHLVAAHFSPTAKGPELNRLVSGKYSQEQSDRQIAASIRSFWKKEKLPSRLVCTCLHSRALVVRYFHYTNITLDELAMTLALEAEEALQIPAAEQCMDWYLDPSCNEDPNHQKLLSGTWVAAPRKTVKRHLDLIKSAGLYSVNVEFSGSALCNFYSFIMEGQEVCPTCLVSLTNRTSDIVMYTAKGMYPRVLFCSNETWESNIDYLLENIQNALLYYHLKIKHAPVKKIVLVGKAFGSNHFLKLLEQKASIPVEVFDQLPPVLLKKDGMNRPEIASGSIATAIGLALREAAS